MQQAILCKYEYINIKYKIEVSGLFGVGLAAWPGFKLAPLYFAGRRVARPERTASSFESPKLS